MPAKVKVNPKKAGRKRRASGGTLAGLGLLVAGVWVWSGFRFAWISPAGVHSIEVLRGRIGLCRGLPANSSLPLIRIAPQNPPEWGWNEWWHTHMKNGSEMWVFSFWPIPFLLWTPAALLLRSGIIARRRAMTGKCTRCGYDLAGLVPNTPCPECGRETTVIA